jgi:hypothetical protein
MRPDRAVIWILSIGTLLTSLVCSFIPIPPQMSVTLEPEQQTMDARLTDLARPSSTPAPTFTPQPSATPLPPTSTPTPPLSSPTPVQMGGIAGNLSYPGGFMPPLRVVAFRIGDSTWKTVDMPQNARNYQINDLQPGKYFVVAYLITPGNTDPTYGGGYSRAVLCGLTAKCTDHALLEVEVKSGEVTHSIHPTDWNATKGAFPRNPTIP